MPIYYKCRISAWWCPAVVLAILANSGCRLAQPWHTSSAKPSLPVREGAQAHLSRRQCVERERHLREALTANPTNNAAWLELGETLAELAKWSAAAEAFATALTLDPGDAYARYRMARLYVVQGDGKRALAELDRALRTNPNLGDAHALKGELLHHAGRNDEALAAWKAGWECRPPSTLAGRELAKWHLTRGDLSGAASKLALCVVYEPSDVTTRQLYADCLERQGKVDEALSQWEQIINSGEGGAAAYLKLARLYQATGRPRAADTALAHAQRIDPSLAGAIRLTEEQLPAASPGSLPDRDYRELATNRR